MQISINKFVQICNNHVGVNEYFRTELPSGRAEAMRQPRTGFDVFAMKVRDAGTTVASSQNPAGFQVSQSIFHNKIKSISLADKYFLTISNGQSPVIDCSEPRE